MWHDTELEREILQCAIVGGDCDQNNLSFVPLATIPHDAFSNVHHRRAFSEMQRAFDDGDRIDTRLFRGRGKELGIPEAELVRIWNWGPGIPDRPGIDRLIRRLLELSAKRQIAERGEALVSPDASLEEITARLEELGEIATAAAPIVRARDGRELARHLERILDGGDEESAPISTGIPALDAALDGGMGRGHLVVVTADTGGGKTLTMTNLAAAALRAGLVVGYVSQELTEADMLRRLAGVLSSSVVSRTIRPHDRALDVPREMASWGTRFRMESNRLTVGQVAQFARVHARQNGRLDLLVVDHIQITPTDRAQASRQLELAYVSERLSAIPKELNCVVVTGSQINEQGNTREARDTEMNARVVLRVQWPSQTDPSRASNEVEIFIKKNTMGPAGMTVPLRLGAGLTLREVA